MSVGGYTEKPWVDMKEIMRQERSTETVGRPVMQDGTESERNTCQSFPQRLWAPAHTNAEQPILPRNPERWRW